MERGNDLSTPMPQYGFPGLRPGDQWCVCAARWAEALEAGAACPVVLAGTHLSALEYVDLGDLKAHAVLRRPSRCARRGCCIRVVGPPARNTGCGETGEAHTPSELRQPLR